MSDGERDPNPATILDVSRVVTDMRSEMNRRFGDVDRRFDELDRRVAGQTESALNVALHVLGDLDPDGLPSARS